MRSSNEASTSPTSERIYATGLTRGSLFDGVHVGVWFNRADRALHVDQADRYAGRSAGLQRPGRPGTLVRYGEDSNNCSAVKLQFDTGRGTVMRLAELNIAPEQLNAVFFTHMHNDHTEGFADLVTLRWMFFGTGPKIDAVCTSDVVSTLGFTVSCRKFTTHIADSFIQAGEVAQRHSEIKERTAGGPADLINTITFEAKDEPQTVWSSGDVKVSAIRSTHIAGHVSYRVDTPAGSVVIGGDAGNDVPLPPRSSSASEQVERLAKGADVIVHSTIHPAMGPDKGSGFFPHAYFRQSNAFDLGAMAKRQAQSIWCSRI
jgi:ribonuclease Z